MAVSSSSSSSSFSWSSLPNELLEKILIRLNNPLDVFQCCYVSVSWRSVATQVYWNRIQIPLLLILNREEIGNLCDILTGKTQPIDLSKVQDRWICNSTNGWLLTIGLCSPYKVNLWNPISRTEILLPFASKFPKFESQRIKQIEGFIKRCITSSLSPLDPNCIVVVIYGLGSERKLAFCKPGDREWKAFQDSEEVYSFVDILFYKGQFYATDIKGKIYGCELGPNPKIIIVLEPQFQFHQKQKYLAESLSGDFLMIHRNWNWVELEDGIETSFEVYKVDLGKKELIKIESLGNEALFLGCNGRMSVSSTANCRANCIYFIHGAFEGFADDGFGFKHASIYDLETSRIKRLKTSESYNSQFDWIMPSLHI